MFRLLFWLCMALAAALFFMGHSSSYSDQAQSVQHSAPGKSLRAVTTPASPATPHISLVATPPSSPKVAADRQVSPDSDTKGVKKTLVAFQPATATAQIYVSKKDAPAGYVNHRPATKAPAIPAQSTQMVEVTGNKVNLRRGPSISNPVVIALTRGTRAEVLNHGATGWVHLRTTDGTQGYMSAKFLAPAR